MKVLELSAAIDVALVPEEFKAACVATMLASDGLGHDKTLLVGL
jgi:hypothetical protein